jgi:hypothetical protein
MPSFARRSLRTTVAAVAATLLLAPAAAHAQTFVGYTTGCFGVGCAPSTSASLAPGLSFAGTGSAGTPTSFGTAAGGTLALSNLGTFSLVRPQGGGSYSSPFTLGITFTQPGGNSTFQAAVTGTLNGGGNGIVSIAFGAPQTVTYAGGSFLLDVNDVSFANSATGTTAITGAISASVQSTVPEPATVGLMAAGLLGVAGVGYRRRRA